MRPFELDELIRKEKGYNLETISVEPLSGGDAFDALAFISSEWHILDQPVAPTRRYAELCLSGAIARSLPDEYVDWLRAEARTARGSSSVPSSYYETKSRRAASLVACGMMASLVGFPVTRRVAKCSAVSWEKGTSCESFFVPERFR